jgi:D-alanyl-D-alanine dipeptidase
VREDGLAGAGLAGDRVQARLQAELGAFDEEKVFDSELEEHAAMETRGADGKTRTYVLPLHSLRSCCEKAALIAVLLSLSANTAAHAGPLKQAGLTPLKDVRLDIRYATKSNFTGAVLPGYCKPMALLKRPAAAAVRRGTATRYKDGSGLVIFDGYRPARATRAMVKWGETTGHENDLRDGWVARRSNHNRGAAVDLGLTRDGKVVYMGTDFYTFTTRSHFANASGKALKNRKRLRAAMEAQGFRQYANEWWHYDFPAVTSGPLDLTLGC